MLEAVLLGFVPVHWASCACEGLSVYTYKGKLVEGWLNSNLHIHTKPHSFAWDVCYGCCCHTQERGQWEGGGCGGGRATKSNKPKWRREHWSFLLAGRVLARWCLATAMGQSVWNSQASFSLSLTPRHIGDFRATPELCTGSMVDF